MDKSFDSKKLLKKLKKYGQPLGDNPYLDLNRIWIIYKNIKDYYREIEEQLTFSQAREFMKKEGITSLIILPDGLSPEKQYNEITIAGDGESVLIGTKVRTLKEKNPEYFLRIQELIKGPQTNMYV